MISTRRRRDTFILGGVVAFCVLLLIGYLFGW
jgi:Golgi SNAP receptor complex protein 1